MDIYYIGVTRTSFRVTRKMSLSVTIGLNDRRWLGIFSDVSYTKDAETDRQ